MAASLSALEADEIQAEILKKTAGSEHHKAISDNLSSVLVAFDDSKERKKADEWLDWARCVKDLKMVRASVPLGILPNGHQGELIDVKVFSRGPDDAVYDGNKKIRDKVARGNCFLRLEDGPESGVRCVLYALKKFTGGLGDDDDRDKGDNFTWQRYFTRPLESAKTVVAMRKANGEAAHLSVVQVYGSLIMCGGSKNVHLLFRNREDVKRYREDRFRIATEVCETVLDALDNLEEGDRLLLLSFLAKTRFTAVFEILSPHHQHVEDFSHMTRPELRFIAWTTTDLEPEGKNQLCTMPPHIGIEIARALGLSTVDYEILPAAKVQERMKEIRSGYNYEGEVLYFLDEADAVIGLLKKKTVWYIVCRAIREKVRGAARASVKNPDTFNLTKSLRKHLGGSYLKWVISELSAASISMDDIQDKFPVLWKRHLEVSGETDHIQPQSVEAEISSES